MANLKITSVKWIIISTEWLIIQTIVVNLGLGFFNRQSEFSTQLQRIVAQPHKIVYESLKSWYF